MDAGSRRQQFAEAYERLISRGDFLEMLRLRACGGLSRFSLGNVLWLMFQAEERAAEVPTLLLTYKAWQRLDRQVVRGAKSWSVLRPYHRKVEQDDGTSELFLSGFGTVPEFDVAQTTGAPLPEPVGDLAGEGFAAHLERLTAWAGEQGITVSFTDTGDANGWYERKANAIAVKATNAPDEQLATLVHELVHWLGIGYDAFERAEAEMITETAACIVLLGFGLDATAQSTEYVASWAKTHPERALSLLERAEQVARTLEAALGTRVLAERAA
jgi:antirestriction protein ArdC